MVSKNGAKRSGRCVVHVTVNDVNDNSPIFVGLPYFASVQVDATVGTLVKQVQLNPQRYRSAEVRFKVVYALF